VPTALATYPDWVVERVLALLQPQDARLLAQLLNETSPTHVCWFDSERWHCRRRRSF